MLDQFCFLSLQIVLPFPSALPLLQQKSQKFNMHISFFQRIFGSCFYLWYSTLHQILFAFICLSFVFAFPNISPYFCQYLVIDFLRRMIFDSHFNLDISLFLAAESDWFYGLSGPGGRNAVFPTNKFFVQGPYINYVITFGCPERPPPYVIL